MNEAEKQQLSQNESVSSSQKSTVMIVTSWISFVVGFVEAVVWLLLLVKVISLNNVVYLMLIIPIGLVLGIISLKNGQRTISKAGIVLNLLSLVIMLVYLFTNIRID